jgi:NAD(P)-dependent dehydrogenase (short-subunit alcohol dehydrogenase family)
VRRPHGGKSKATAKAAVFLASDESEWVTGDVIKASGCMI